MMLTLWLYALQQAVGSAREIARLVGSDIGYRWIAGNVDISHQKLSQFRVGQREALNELMTNILATLMNQGLLRLLADTSSRARFMAAARDRARRDGIILDQPKRTFPLRAAFERPGDGALGTPRRVPGNLNQPPYATRIAQLSAAKFFLGPP